MAVPELSANICAATLSAHANAGAKLGAVTVFAYADAVEPGGYTAARAVFAPDGDWSKADASVPLERWKMNITVAEKYLSPAADAFTDGNTVQLVDDTPVGVSRNPKSWGDADLIGHVPSKTRARILSHQQFNMGPESTLTRYQIETLGPRKLRGWVSASVVRPEPSK